MHRLKNTQYFLIISEINLFPEIKPNTIDMIEQMMNALLLSSKENIQEGINRVLRLEFLCANKLADDYVSVLHSLQNFLEKHHIYIVQGEQVRLCYPRYHNSKFYYKDISKQTAINTEFAMEKKVSYNGKEIIFEDSYNFWINSISNKHRENNAYNPADKFMYHIIEPQINLKHIAAVNIIQEETYKYVDECRKVIAFEEEIQ